MDHRLQLQETLEAITGVKKVYFQPTNNTKLEYPCIKFNLSDRTAVYANDRKYIKGEQFTITFITRDATTATKVLDQLEDIALCDFDRLYVADGLYHYVFIKNY